MDPTIFRTYLREFNAANYDALARYYADDVLFSFGHGPVLRGRDAVVAFYRPFHEHVRETVEVVVGLEQAEVEVWLRGACIARHTKCLEPGSWIRDSTHFQGLYRPETASPAAPPVSPVTRPLSVYAEVVEGGRP